jgi:hypothetical protein
MRSTHLLCGPLSALVLAACSEQGLTGKEDIPVPPAPDILVDPPAIGFGEVPVGASATQSFTVTNIGDGALDVRDIAIATGGDAFAVLGSDFTFTLAPDETRAFEVRYTPPDGADHFGAIQVASNDADGDNSTVDLLGIGLAPDILVEPSALSWTGVARGDVAVQSFTVTNVGGAPLTVSDIVLDGGVDFEILGPELAFVLEPGEATTVDVAFAPLQSDLVSDLVRVLSDDPDGERSTVDLSGEGLAPDLVIEPAVYSFGDQFVPCGDSVDLTLSNVGGDDLVIEAIDFTSAGMLLLDDAAITLPLTLAPGASATVAVDFLPMAAGDDASLLSVTSNDPAGVETASQDARALWLASSTESFAAPVPPPVDVLITIDQSCSMEIDNQDDVEQGFPLFLQELQQISDWRLLLVTNPNGCTSTGVIDQFTPNAESLIVNNAFVAAHNDNGGANTTEKLLELTDKALQATGPGGCNQLFLRPGALLHVIALSDEPEQSGRAASYWVDRFDNYVTDPALLKVSGVLDLNGSCGSGAAGYTDAVNLTGGASLDICDPSWGSDFTDIASEVLPIVPVYQLSAQADPATLVATVNGAPATATVDNALQQVTITSPPVDHGDVVEITYNVPGTCP